MTTEKKEPGNKVPSAEDIQFWQDMDGPHFADYVLLIAAVVTIDNVEYKVADFCSREWLSETWDQCVETISEWLADSGAADDPRKKNIVYWMAIGMTCGTIFGTIGAWGQKEEQKTEEKPTPDK